MFSDMGVADGRRRRSTAAVSRVAADDDAGRASIAAGWSRPTTGEIVAGGGITILPWPPGPRYAGDRLAFVYNVYTEPAHRGAAWRAWSWRPSTPGAATTGITSVALNASRIGQPLYESMGYRVTAEPDDVSGECGDR